MFSSAMYRTFLICLCLVVAFAALADYRIVKMNTPVITVGGKALHADDVFASDAPIRWTDDCQAIIVADTDSGERMLVVAERFRQTGASTMQEYTAAVAEGPVKTGIEDLKTILSGRHFLLDTLAIETGVATDADHFFFISYPFTDHEVSKWVENNDGTFTLHSGLFPTGTRQEKSEVPVKIYFYDKTSGAVTPVCENMTVVILPYRL